MDYNKEIERIGIKKIFIAKKLGLSNTIFSFYLNDVRTMPEAIEFKLQDLLKAYDLD